MEAGKTGASVWKGENTWASVWKGEHRGIWWKGDNTGAYACEGGQHRGIWYFIPKSLVISTGTYMFPPF